MPHPSPRSLSVRLSTWAWGRYLEPPQFATSCNLSSRVFRHIAWCRLLAASYQDIVTPVTEAGKSKWAAYQKKKKPLTRFRTFAWQTYKDMNISIRSLFPHIGNVFHFAQSSIIGSGLKNASSNSLLRLLVVYNIDLQIQSLHQRSHRGNDKAHFCESEPRRATLDNKLDLFVINLHFQVMNATLRWDGSAENTAFAFNRNP